MATVVMTIGGEEAPIVDAWWRYYAASGSGLPVCFVNTLGGVTPALEQWCRDRGSYLDISKAVRRSLPIFVKHGGGRKICGWYAKVFAINACPDEVVVWVDHDVAVLEPIEWVVSPAPGPTDPIRAAVYPSSSLNVKSNLKWPIGGVLALHKQNPILARWVQLTRQGPVGEDEVVLWAAAFKQRKAFRPLEGILHPEMGDGDVDTTGAKMVHWWGGDNKKFMLQFAPPEKSEKGHLTLLAE